MVWLAWQPLINRRVCWPLPIVHEALAFATTLGGPRPIEQHAPL